ncbi:hypothetical protein FH972_002527 [Carpinus fangiana]|uniref:S-protein homolog n=1 Tax=Carpinus fangiana TaxID=176857 RepID=A0A5N6QHI1_9ROSI|nr:hypothetical protein FH972_002527 [Carpinus fangiana]
MLGYVFKGGVAFEAFSNQKMSPSLNLSLLAIFMIMSRPITSNAFINHFTVHVINGFKDYTILEVHCKSKDNVLRLRHIGVNEEFQWQFQVNFWGSTLYWCNMWWVGGQRYVEVFPADDDKFLNQDCGDSNCRWMGKKDGIYLFNFEHKEYRLKYTWEL